MLPPIVSWSIEQVMMTLCAIAYAPLDDIESQLANSTYATAGAWNLVWGPGTSGANMAYVVQNNSENLYAVVIQGTQISFSLSTIKDLYEDLDAGHQVPWAYPEVSGAAIAQGTQVGLENLTSLTSGAPAQTLFGFLSTLPANSAILVTGHSLGGCLATVLAPWLQYQLAQSGQQATVVPFTFAAPTAGNPAFASFYDTTFAPGAWRYYNNIDIVPMAWATLLEMKDQYDSPGPNCPDDVKFAVDLVFGWLTLKDNVTYAQTTGTVVALPGAPVASPGWFLEASLQHNHNTYLNLLGAPQVVIPSATPESNLGPALGVRPRLAGAASAVAA
jgi:triacylglycerol lipase